MARPVHIPVVLSEKKKVIKNMLSLWSSSGWLLCSWQDWCSLNYLWSSTLQVLGASHISKHRLLPRVLNCFVHRCLVSQILDIPVSRILICPSAKLITGRCYLHFCGSYHYASYYFIWKYLISWARLWAEARVWISHCLTASCWLLPLAQAWNAVWFMG